MIIQLTVNGEMKEWEIAPSSTLLEVLRREGYFSVKFGGCSAGECGSCTVLMDGRPVNSCAMLAAQASGHQFQTVESVGEHPDQGWKKTEGLHPIQQAMIEIGAIQCGYCTPAMVLAAKALLAENSSPTESDVRDALSGILCRCTGYLKPVQAILRAAAVLRGEDVPPLESAGPVSAGWFDSPHSAPELSDGSQGDQRTVTRQQVMPKIWTTPETALRTRVGKPERKVDAIKLVQGKPAFTSDIEPRGMLVAKVLHSPLAHAWIKRIDVSRARALPGVAAVLTWQDIPRVVYSTAGQSDPIPGPLDAFSLDQKVRFIGDRVAFVAAETREIAELALSFNRG